MVHCPRQLVLCGWVSAQQTDLVRLYGHATEVSHHLAGRGNVHWPYACAKSSHLVRPAALLQADKAEKLGRDVHDLL